MIAETVFVNDPGQSVPESTRKELIDAIMNRGEDTPNRQDSKIEGFRYLIGRTKSGHGISLVWRRSKRARSQPVLTHRIMDTVLDEAKAAGCRLPVHIYAAASTAPISEELYRFHQVSEPNREPGRYNGAGAVQG